MMCRAAVRIVLALLWCAIAPLRAAPTALYTVENYDVSLRPDLANRLLYGEAKIRLVSQSSNDISSLQLDAGGLRIISVLEGTSSQYFERDHNMLFVVLKNPLRGDAPRTITVRYEAGPARRDLNSFPIRFTRPSPATGCLATVTLASARRCI